MWQGKKIVLGVTGSIAAYKAALLVRLWVKNGAEVQVVMTPAAKEFITPLTLSALSGRPVLCDFFRAEGGVWNSHVDLGRWADAMVIAPCTASTIGKMASGVADNLLVTTYLSMKAPVFIAPAMDLDMYAHPSTVQNIERLRSYGNHLIEPASGELASHLMGKGRMEEPENIIRCMEDYFSSASSLKGKKILITAGPTYEKIDPVRFIGNYSSGKMGYAIAAECATQGAEVTLLSGPVSLALPHPKVQRVEVESAYQMYCAAMELFPRCDAAILSAAVADFTPKEQAQEKIKRISSSNLLLELSPTRDIAAALGASKRENQRLVGFALETNDALAHAQKKMKEKRLDSIVLNSLEDEGAGFRTDTNKITILHGSEKSAFPLKSKKEVAKDIVKHLSSLFALLCIFFLPSSLSSQELKATVSVNYSKIQGTNTEVFTVLESALNEFINERKWSTLTFEENERIYCNFNLIVDSYSDDGSFSCTLMVQSTRPVYGSSYSSPVFKYQDVDLKFTYRAYDRLEFQDDYLENELTSVLAFYAYLIIGMDLDSMGELGGTEYLNKALSLANSAQSLGGSGWKAAMGTQNRYAIISDYMNGALLPLRQLMYRYHRLGLDVMYRDSDKGRALISSTFDLLTKAHEDRPLSYLPQLFTELKQEELVNIYSKGSLKERQQAVTVLSNINPSLSATWGKISVH